MLTLAQAQTIMSAALAHADVASFKPLVIAILDARGAQKLLVAQDGTSLKRAEIALGKERLVEAQHILTSDHCVGVEQEHLAVRPLSVGQPDVDPRRETTVASGVDVSDA